MRIFDPKNQFGSSLLSSADTQKSSVKLEKQMAVGGGAITLTSTDISDIENWELSNARVKVDGQMISFLPDTSRDGDGNLIVTLGETFSDVVLVLKRTVFDGMKQEEEDVTIEVKIQRLMAKTMAAATAPTTRTVPEIQENIQEWQDLGAEAKISDPDKYPNADLGTLEGYHISYDGTSDIVEVNDCLISAKYIAGPDGKIEFDAGVNGVKWHSDLPSLTGTYGSGDLSHIPLVEWTGKLPNLQNASAMFANCEHLTSWTVELPNSLTNAFLMFSRCSEMNSFSTPSGTLPNSLTNASFMFSECFSLTSWTVALPNSITDAQNMFSSCYSLREFTPSLAGLTNCEDFDGMFWGCVLNEDSIRNVLTTLPDQTGKTKLYIYDVGCDGTIDQATQKELGDLAQQISGERNYYISLSWN